MNLILNIAWTHVRTRARQTLIAGFGVATGVGFSIMMASLMEGSQDDFVKTLVNVLPHVTISDERNKPTLQPGEQRYAAAEIHGLTPEVRRRGIKNPMATMASLQGMGAGLDDAFGQLEGSAPLRRPRRRGFHHRHRPAHRGEGFLARDADAPGRAVVALPRHQRHHSRRPSRRKAWRPTSAPTSRSRAAAISASTARWSARSIPASDRWMKTRPMC